MIPGYVDQVQLENAGLGGVILGPLGAGIAGGLIAPEGERMRAAGYSAGGSLGGLVSGSLVGSGVAGLAGLRKGGIPRRVVEQGIRRAGAGYGGLKGNEYHQKTSEYNTYKQAMSPEDAQALTQIAGGFTPLGAGIVGGVTAPYGERLHTGLRSGAGSLGGAMAGGLVGAPLGAAAGYGIGTLTQPDRLIDDPSWRNTAALLGANLGAGIGGVAGGYVGAGMGHESAQQALEKKKEREKQSAAQDAAFTKAAFALGALKKLAQYQVDPDTFVKAASQSRDPRVVQLANLVNQAVYNLRNASSR